MKYSQPEIFSEKETQILAERANLVSTLNGTVQTIGTDEVVINDGLETLSLSDFLDEESLQLLDQIIKTGILIY